MAFLVIPNEVYADRAIVWVAAINDAFDPAVTVLEYGANQMPLHDGWNHFATADRKNRIDYQRVVLPNLSARTTSNLALRVGGTVKADATVITLPDRLPVAGERPFIALLASCYFGREDKAGAVGLTYMRLPLEAKPEIKILCGDQVYLDNPPQDFLNFLHGHDWLQSRSFGTYVATWTQLTFGGGFGQFLRNNANFFSSDDHEYWNNAPDRGLNVPFFTVTRSGRDTWWAIARELYQIFQTSRNPPGQFQVDPSRSSPIEFSVPPLSFCIADTRFNRQPAPGDFMLPEDLEAIRNWIDNLDGPGVLVVGQPVFDNPGSLKDWHLPNYRQYPQLIQFLRSSQHSIVILTGDVHFGRLAYASLRPELGTRLLEVISSPMQLVPFGGGKYQPAPQVFGSVTSEPEFSLGRNHFLTLEFTAPSAQRASMVVKFWPIIKNGEPLQSHVIGGGPIELI